MSNEKSATASEEDLPIEERNSDDVDLEVQEEPLLTQVQLVDGNHNEGQQSTPTVSHQSLSFLKEKVHGIIFPVVNPPQEYDRKQMAQILVLICFLGFMATFTNFIYVPAVYNVADYFNVSLDIATMSVSLYAATHALAPIWWGAFSDSVGRRLPIILQYVFGALLALATSFSPSIAWLISLRLAQGLFVSGAIVVAQGCLVDVFPFTIRAKAFSVFNASLLFGVIFGPVIGGYIVHQFDWRYIFRFLAFCDFIVLGIEIALLPETNNNRTKLGPFFFISPSFIVKFVQPIRFAFYPVFITVFVQLGFCFGSVFLFYVLIPIEVQERFGWSTKMSGFSLLANSVGGLCGVLVAGPTIDSIRKRYKKHGSRLFVSNVSAPLVALSICACGWTVQRSLVLCLCFAFFSSFFLSLVQTAIFTFSFEEKPRYAAFVGGLAGFTQQLFATVFGQLAPVARSVGPEYICTIVCFVIFATVLPTFCLSIFRLSSPVFDREKKTNSDMNNEPVITLPVSCEFVEVSAVYCDGDEGNEGS